MVREAWRAWRLASGRRRELGRRRTAPSIPWSRTRRIRCRPRSSRDRADARRRAARRPPRRVARGDRVPAHRPRADSRRCSKSSASGPTPGARPTCDPVEYLADVGYLQPGMLVVHGVHLTDDALERLRQRRRGRRHVSAEQRLGRRRAAAAVAFLRVRACRWRSAPTASRRPPTLNLFDELAEMRRIAPDVAAAALLDSATRQGARRSASAATTARSRPASAPRSSPSTFRPAIAMWKNTWSAACRRIGPSRPHDRLTCWPASAPTRRSSASATRCSRCRLRWSARCWPSRLVAVRLDAAGLDRRLHGRGAQRGDGLQPAGRRVASTRAIRARRCASCRPGACRVGEARVFVVVSSIVFVVCARASSGWLCLVLSPVALAIVFWYSLAKRVTAYTQAFLGLAMAVAPVGGWIAAGGPRALEPWLLGLAIGTWVAGFDILYACQDLEFDRREGLRSIPVRFGIARVALDLARAARRDRRWRWRRSASCAGARADLRRRRRRRRAAARLGAVARARRRPVAGQARVRPERLGRHAVSSRRPRCDVYLGMDRRMSDRRRTRRRIAVGVTGASGAIYAVRTIAALLETRLPARDRVQRLRPAAAHRRARADAKVERLRDLLVERYGDGVRRARSSLHSNRDLARRSRAAATAATAWSSCRAR